MSSVNRTGLVACSVVLVVLIHIDLLRVMSKFQLRKPDFMALYQAGRELLHKRFPMVVNRFPILNGQDYIAELSNNPYPPDNEHPPFEAIIFACLALLKYRFAYLIWYGCNMLMLFRLITLP